jgi:predicted transcriptional regulator
VGLEGVPMVMRDIMTARIVTVEMDDRLEVVKEIFDTMNFHSCIPTMSSSRSASSVGATCSNP